MFWLLVDNASCTWRTRRDARAVSVFLKPGVDEAAARALAQRLRGNRDVIAVASGRREQGLEEFRQRSGFADALNVLHDNPLPAVLIVRLAH